MPEYYHDGRDAFRMVLARPSDTLCAQVRTHTHAHVCVHGRCEMRRRMGGSYAPNGTLSAQADAMAAASERPSAGLTAVINDARGSDLPAAMSATRPVVADAVTAMLEVLDIVR